MLALATMLLAVPAANAETRTLKLYFVHTKERAEITFKRNGRYDQSGLKKINNFLRDWRRNEPTKMDPRLLDLVWETYQSVGARDYIHVVSAYRSPATNSMLRKRSKGVAQKSQHTLGKAMDFYIPGVPLKKLRDTGLRMQTGGVGYYPRSGSPFVHLDVGSVRHWPRMSRQELVSVFPNGKTLHVPSDGKPLPGYETAVASYESRKKSGTTALALASAGPSVKTRTGGLLSALFGGGADEEEDNSSGEEEVAVASLSQRSTTATAASSGGGIAIVPPELANPADISGSIEREETPGTIIAALPARSIPLPGFAPRPQVDVGPADIPFGMAQAPLEAANVRFGAAETPLEGDPGEEEGDLAEGNIPFPTFRPDLGQDDQSALVALAAPLPEARPSSDELLLASLEDSGGAAAKSTRLAVLSPPASPKTAYSRLGDGPLPAPSGAVRTTEKSARARVADTRPSPKPLVVAAQPEAARWALDDGESQLAYGGASSPTARLILAAVPEQVYAAGFQRNAVVADAGRFTGKAVSFMPVARFQTN
ncbi:DUF882 domain-containing protein [Mesorhizobium sp. 10J20-29]